MAARRSTRQLVRALETPLAIELNHVARGIAEEHQRLDAAARPEIRARNAAAREPRFHLEQLLRAAKEGEMRILGAWFEKCASDIADADIDVADTERREGRRLHMHLTAEHLA